MSRVRVKICGITSIEDALRAAHFGADAIGLNFWPRSKRHVDVPTAREIVEALPPLVVPVGVFVNQPIGEVRVIAREAGLGAVQLHGAEPPEDCCEFDLPVWKAFRCGPGGASDGAPSTDEIPQYAEGVRAYVLDAAAPGYGGTGQACDWDLAAELAERYHVVLAGGLTPENVGAAIRIVEPWAVDVASGVESAPGVKDPELMARFIRAAQENSL